MAERQVQKRKGEGDRQVSSTGTHFIRMSVLWPGPQRVIPALRYHLARSRPDLLYRQLGTRAYVRDISGRDVNFGGISAYTIRILYTQSYNSYGYSTAAEGSDGNALGGKAAKGAGQPLS